MTEPNANAELAGARDQLDVLCVAVGLIRRPGLPAAPDVPPAPREACLWSSDYAQLLFWPCHASTAAAIEAAAREGQAWFDEVLVQSEKAAGGQPIDGYLVLALPVAPGDEAREDVRRLELSAQVCRKHLIWPALPTDAEYEPGLWQRIADVTVLGLPDPEDAPGAELQWPELDKDAQALWDRLAAQGVAATIVQDEAV